MPGKELGEKKAALLWRTENPLHRKRKGIEMMTGCGTGFAQEENLSDYRLRS